MCRGYRSGVAAVIRHHLVVMRLFGNFVAVKRRHCRGYWHHLVVMRLFGKFLRLFGGDAAVIRHHLGGDAIICCDYKVRKVSNLKG